LQHLLRQFGGLTVREELVQIVKALGHANFVRRARGFSGGIKLLGFAAAMPFFHSTQIPMLIGASATFLIRILAFFYQWKLPTWQNHFFVLPVQIKLLKYWVEYL